ncbi:polyphosphate kinase 2 [Variovorax humicola]
MSKKERTNRVFERAIAGRDHTEDPPLAADPEIDPQRRSSIEHKQYKQQLRLLQIELVKLQRQLIAHGDSILVVLEGRDAAGKDGSIKRIVAHLSPRETRVVALGPPSDRERSGWYFARYVEQLPIGGEMVLFNRSWYNRAGVEQVSGFCSRQQHEEFMASVPKFEQMLVSSGIQLLKYYLDIGRDEQATRLADRSRDPLTKWKISPVDAMALKRWKAYSKARDEMLLGTNSDIAPWHIVRTDVKHLARLNLMRDLLSRLHYPGKDKELVKPDPDIAFEFTPDCIDGRRLVR